MRTTNGIIGGIIIGLITICLAATFSAGEPTSSGDETFWDLLCFFSFTLLPISSIVGFFIARWVFDKSETKNIFEVLWGFIKHPPQGF